MTIDTSSLQNVGDLSKYLNDYGDLDIDMNELTKAIAKASSELSTGYLNLLNLCLHIYNLMKQKN